MNVTIKNNGLVVKHFNRLVNNLTLGYSVTILHSWKLIKKKVGCHPNIYKYIPRIYVCAFEQYKRNTEFLDIQ